MPKLIVTIINVLLIGYIMYKLLGMFRKDLKRDVLFLAIAVVSLGFMEGLLLYSFVPPTDKGSVYITAAHIPKEEVESKGYLLAFKDESKDTAYYLNTKWSPPKSLTGKRIKVSGLYGEVTKVTEDCFYVSLESPEAIVKGLSGSRVVNGTEVLGFVSALEDGMLKCIYT